MNRRTAGALIRVDILVSLLQKACRRRKPKEALFACALLCRENLWGWVLRRLIVISMEDTNSVTEPYLHERIYRLSNEILPILRRRGVSRNTEASRRRIFQLCIEICVATKTRMVANAAAAALYFMARDRNEILNNESIQDLDDLLQFAHAEWHKAWESKDKESLLKWTAVIEVMGATHKIYGLNRLWGFLTTETYHGETVTMTYNMAYHQKLNGKTIGHPRLALYEAIVLRLEPVRALGDQHEYPSSRLSKEKLISLEKYWNSLFERPLEISLRKEVNWDVWLPFVGDKHTALGKGRNTLAELVRKYELPDNFSHEPDGTGYNRPSNILHFFQRAAIVRGEMMDDPYVDVSREFYLSIERGQTLKCFGSGTRAAKSAHIKKVLHAMFSTKYRPTVTKQIVKTRKKQPRRIGSATKKRKRTHNPKQPSILTFLKKPDPDIIDSSDIIDSDIIDSDTDSSTASLKLKKSNKPKRSNSMIRPTSRVSNSSNDPQPLPGLIPVTMEFHAPKEIYGVQVVVSQMAQTPCGRKPTSWYIRLSNNETYWIKGCSELSSSTPIYLDTIKPMFGLISVGMQWSENQLVCIDFGHGAPYDQITHKVKKGPTVKHYTIVDKTKTGVPMVRTAVDKLIEQGTFDDNIKRQITHNLLFRALFWISDTHLNNLLFVENKRQILSVDEMTVSRKIRDDIKELSDALFSRGKRPKKQVLELFKQYWSKPDTKEHFKTVLERWKIQSSGLPPPPRFISGFPTLEERFQSIERLKSFFDTVEMSIVEPEDSIIDEPIISKIDIISSDDDF